jgi:hypothetical protein
VTVADFTIDRPGLLEINRKIATMGGGDSHRVKKKASLCSASVCFFGGFGRFEIEGLPPQKKNIGGKAWAGPPTITNSHKNLATIITWGKPSTWVFVIYEISRNVIHVL